MSERSLHRWLQRIADDELRTWDANARRPRSRALAKELERRAFRA